MQLDGEYLLNPIQFSLIRNRVIPLDVCWTSIGEFGAGASCRMTVRSKMIMATTDEQEIKVDILVLWVMLLLCMYNSRGLVKGLSVVLHVINSLNFCPSRKLVHVSKRCSQVVQSCTELERNNFRRSKIYTPRSQPDWDSHLLRLDPASLLRLS